MAGLEKAVKQTVAPPNPVVLPDESAQAQAAVSSSGSGGVGSVVAETSGGLTINLIFDAAAMAAPASFRAGIEQAAALLSSAISDKITLNFNIDYSGTGGGAAAGPDNGQWVGYSTVRSDLINNASIGDAAFNALPAGSTIQGQSSVAVWNSQLKLWGLLGANDTTTDDGSATFATDINPSLLVGVALHELTHAMGRVPYGSQPDIFDFDRFTSAGVRLFTDNIPASAAYFSLNGGSAKLADYGQNSDPSDFLNSGVQGANDPFNEYYSGSTLQQLTAIDLKQLDALGFHLTSAAAPVVIESSGSTALVEVANNYVLDPVAGGTGPELKFGGAVVVAGQFGGWIPIGAEITAIGYEIAWKVAGTDQYTVWNTDSNGNYLSNAVGVVSGTSYALESLEASFHQDLNGDGIIGVYTNTIESSGSTALVQVANNYFLNPVAGGTGPELKFGGVAVVASQFGGWTPMGAEITATGYEIAWKVAGADQYTVWNTDSSGNYVSNAIGVVSGSTATLESLETSFHQDLNGDGEIGIVPHVIALSSTISLAEVGSNYLLDPAGGGTGPELKFGGAAVVTGEFGGWMPIGAATTATGYEVAWKVAGADEYTVWNTDSSGNYVSNAIGAVSGTSYALESLEASFHQDLNGDGIVGVYTNTIESAGATALVQVADNYFLDPVAGGTGPELKFGGAVVVAGQFGGWTPIGAEITATGYEIAWKVAGADEYTVWNTDGSGNYASNAIGAVSGSSAAFEAFEAGFHQDLNGDGVIGIPTTTSLAAVSAATSSGSATFDGMTLNLQPSTLSEQIIGFSGDGTLSGSDKIDLQGLHFSAFQSSFDATSGTLSLSDGSTSTALHFLGRYSQDSFHFADDSNGGTLVVAASSAGRSTAASPVSNLTAHDTFVFAPNFGQVSLANFAPTTDTLQFSKSAIADVATLITFTHDDAAGNAVITDAAHDTITLLHVTTAQLLAHQSDFHFV